LRREKIRIPVVNEKKSCNEDSKEKPVRAERGMYAFWYAELQILKVKIKLELLLCTP